MTPGNGPYDWRTMRDRRRMQRMQWRAQRAAWRAQHPSHGHAVAGVVLLIIGLAFLLSNLGVFPIEEVPQILARDSDRLGRRIGARLRRQIRTRAAWRHTRLLWGGSGW